MCTRFMKGQHQYRDLPHARGVGSTGGRRGERTRVCTYMCACMRDAQQEVFVFEEFVLLGMNEATRGES